MQFLFSLRSYLNFFSIKYFCFFQHTKTDLDGFQNLFHRFLQEKGPSVDWGKIQRPPEDSVSWVIFLLYKVQSRIFVRKLAMLHETINLLPFLAQRYPIILLYCSCLSSFIRLLCILAVQVLMMQNRVSALHVTR